MKSLTIRVSDEEHALMQASARRRFMTITGIVRAHFHALAEADGVHAADNPAAQASAPATTQASTAPRYGSLLADLVLPDGTIDARRLVSRMRSKASAGVTRKQFSDEYGISLADMELACNDVAKAGGFADIPGWHASARVNELIAIRHANLVNDQAETPATQASVPVAGKPIPMDDIFDEAPAPAYPAPEDNPPPDWDAEQDKVHLTNHG